MTPARDRRHRGGAVCQSGVRRQLLGHVSLPEVQVPGKPNWGRRTGLDHLHSRQQDSLVSTCGTKSVTAIDVKTMKEVARIPVGEIPDRICTLVLP